MRRIALLTLSISALALSACGMIGGDDKPATTKEAAAPAAAASPIAMKASASEEKEMAAMMGEEAPAPEAVPVEPVTSELADAMNPNTDPLAEAASAPADGAPADITSADHAAAPAPENRTAVSGAPTECPGVEVLPDTKSITYFDDPEGKPSGALIARASLVDIKGGCDYTADGLIVDIDMIMQGRITDKGRYEGRKDLEAFMTFPYFVAIMDPNGKMIDKKIMATAMRFKPQIDDLDHAEKITQTIPLTNLQDGPKYTITVGFQLNRAQLDYNRGSVSAPAAKNVRAGVKKAAEPVAEHEEKKPKKPAEKTSNDPLAEMKKSEKSKPAAPATTGGTTSAPETKTESTSPAAPASGQSSGSKMKPITE